MYRITFVLLFIVHCIGINSHPVKRSLVDEIESLIKRQSLVNCTSDAKFYTTSSNGSLLHSLNCVRVELNVLMAECELPDEEFKYEVLEPIKALMDEKYNITTTPDCDEEKPLEEFLQKFKLLVQEHNSQQ